MAEKSPAEEAGLKEGDVIVSIDKNFSQNLQQYKYTLQSLKGKVKIIVTRDEQLLEIELKVKSIL